MAVKDGFPGFTFGCDPECFVFNPEGQPVSPDFIPGTKLAPHRVPGGAIQRDGMAAEINIEPASTFSVFNRNLDTVIGSLMEFLPDGHTIQWTPSVTFSEDVFRNAPDEHKALGCTPDLDAWTGDVNPPPSPEDDPLSRCAGGHLHIGWGSGLDITDPEHVTNCCELAQQLDWHLAHWAMRLDSDPRRRKTYGRAGAIRIKDYGVEYRTLSNFWVINRERRLYVWNRMQNALNDMRNSFLPERYEHDNDNLRAAINSSSRSTVLERKYRYPLVSEAIGL